MQLYRQVIPGIFVDRPNRFIAHVETAQGMETCHVKNTGRCRELLVPGCRVTLAMGEGKKRKTRWDLVAVHKGDMYINMDSQAPNAAAREALPRLFPGATLIRPEAAFGASRLDFYLEAGERKTYVEVKGVTLEENGVALFPDAPTARGVRHLHELETCVAKGFDACLLLVIQMQGPALFRPNRQTDPAFAHALFHASQHGVRILAYDCVVTETGMALNRPVPIALQ